MFNGGCQVANEFLVSFRRYHSRSSNSSTNLSSRELSCEQLRPEERYQDIERNKEMLLKNLV